MTSPVKSSGFAALKLIGILAVFALSGERVDVQFLSHLMIIHSNLEKLS